MRRGRLLKTFCTYEGVFLAIKIWVLSRKWLMVDKMVIDGSSLTCFLSTLNGGLVLGGSSTTSSPADLSCSEESKSWYVRK